MTIQLTALAADFARAMQLAGTVAGSGKQVPILKACRIEASNAGISIAATNGDHGVSARIDGSGKGVFFVDVALMSAKTALLKGSQDVTIKGDTDGKFVTVSQGKTRWRVPLLDGEAFPVAMTEAVAGAATEVDRAALFGALDAVLPNVDAGDNRIIGRGPLFDCVDGFRVLAAGGRALYVVKIDATPLPMSIVVPLASAHAMMSVFRGGKALGIVVTQDAMSMVSDGVTYRTKLIEGQYPDWRAVLKHSTSGHDGSAVIDRVAAGEAVARAGAVSFTGTKGAWLAARVTLTGDEMQVTSSNRDGEEGYDAIPAEGDGGTFAVGTDKMIEALRGLRGEKVTMRFSKSAEGPVIIADGDEDYRLLMNMRSK